MKKDILYPLRRLHGWLHEYPAYRERRNEIKNTYLREIKAELKKYPDTVFLVLTPEHGNLGDHAITLSETELLDRNNIHYIEVSSNWIWELMRYNLLSIMNRHPIFAQGGGYLGTLWFDAELSMRKIIEKNPESPILLFPNTMFYEDSDWGREELQKSVKIYNRHKSLTIYAREKISYDFMKLIYKDVRLMPDMVMSLERDLHSVPRKGCLLCLRDDREKTRTENQEKIIRQQVAELFGVHVCDTDMVVKGRITVEQRVAALQAKFDEFLGAELVITDRLHGMIFCAITGTPCIVVDSKSPKVRGSYEWIRKLDYIRFVDDVALITEEYHRISKEEHKYDNSHLIPYYEELAKDILANCKEVKQCRRLV
ncbi:MAG: polysaccharide pyruvyl transferase family protein [Lachnospiraceae bacterium]|nr:polysaccharide pyruvyl transferase family protein [Lachnospiraceae bacterium]